MEVQTVTASYSSEPSQAECRGFESHQPLQFHMGVIPVQLRSEGDAVELLRGWGDWGRESAPLPGLVMTDGFP